MKSIKYIKYGILVFFSAWLFTACDLVDPTEVENPGITQEKLFKDASGGAEPLVTGLKYAYSDAVNRAIVFTETASDNYDNTSSFVSTIIDSPEEITPTESYLNDTREIQFKLQILNALALFGLNTILPADNTAEDADYAETHFYRAMALIMLAENFSAFQIQEGGGLVRSEDALLVAIEELNSSLERDEADYNLLRCKLALARTNRLLGNKAEAQAAALEVIGGDSQYLFAAELDPINLTNRLNLFNVRRSSNDLQPLPSLDFLDPKYTGQADAIYTHKAEEAYLILAEINLTDGNIGGAKDYMKAAYDLAKSRSFEVYGDADTRDGRPTGANWKVQLAGESLEGLILDRSEKVEMGKISNCSIDSSMIYGTDNQTRLYKLLYRMRQEIFFGEGRRMSDLGIRLPIMQRAIDASPAVNAGEYGTSVHIPSFIPADDGLDAFSVDEATSTVTITYDMNQRIAENISEVSPFK